MRRDKPIINRRRDESVVSERRDARILNRRREDSILNSISEGLVIYSLEGQVLYMNESALAMAGYSHLDEAWQPVSTHLEPIECYDLNDNAIAKEDFPTNRILRGEKVTDLTLSVWRNAPERRWIGTFVFNGSPLDEHVAVLTIHDISRRQRVEERLDATFTLTPTPLVIVSADELRITRANRALCRLLACREDDILGHKLPELTVFTDPGSLKAGLTAVVKGQLPNGQLEEPVLCLVDDDERYFEITSHPLKIGGASELLVSLRDVTERQMLEADLCEAIQAALNDTSSLSRRVLEELQKRYAPKGDPNPTPLSELTPQEQCLLELIARGLSNKDIASEMDLTFNTVRNYVAQIYQKLNVHSRVEAAIWARERGLGVSKRD